MTDCKKIAGLLFPDCTKTPDDYEALYPPRVLPEGAMVTRFAPSPTGFMHIGNLFSCLIDRLAAGKNGVFYLRIEDTDKKREVAGAIDAILSGLAYFGIVPDEGMSGETTETGEYGPYKQSLRRDIYACFAKSLVEKGLAYPCFCSEEEIAALRERQEKQGVTPGYYGEWACCRSLSDEQIEENLRQGKPYVLRLRSFGSEDKKIFVDDKIKGKLEMPENVQDIVLLKTDGIPTYHFAHAVDDHLMRTTHVVRGDEWISSLPVHIQLFQALGVKPPKYVHIAPIMKLDNGNKRKLSKRKDPESAVSFYVQQGYPAEGVVEYLMTLSNSNFEDWRKANRNAPLSDFPFTIKKMSASGALFDQAKLEDICKEVISRFSADEVFSRVFAWAKNEDEELFRLMDSDPDKARAIFAIDRGGAKPRKDMARWNMAKQYMAYFYDELFAAEDAMPENIAADDRAAILTQYAGVYDEADTKDEWFAKIKALCEPLGFSPDVKAYKKNPDAYKGHVGDVSSVIRVAVTGRRNTPDLYEVMKVLGKDRVLARLQNAR